MKIKILSVLCIAFLFSFTSLAHAALSECVDDS